MNVTGIELLKIDPAPLGKVQTRQRKPSRSSWVFLVSNRNHFWVQDLTDASRVIFIIPDPHVSISAAARKDHDNAGYGSHEGPASRTCQLRAAMMQILQALGCDVRRHQ